MLCCVAGDKLQGGNQDAVMAAATEAVSNAIEGGAAAVSCSITFGSPLYVVPTRLIGEVFDGSDLVAMLVNGTVRGVFHDEMEVEHLSNIEKVGG